MHGSLDAGIQLKNWKYLFGIEQQKGHARKQNRSKESGYEV